MMPFMMVKSMVLNPPPSLGPARYFVIQALDLPLKKAPSIRQGCYKQDFLAGTCKQWVPTNLASDKMASCHGFCNMLLVAHEPKWISIKVHRKVEMHQSSTKTVRISNSSSRLEVPTKDSLIPWGH